MGFETTCMGRQRSLEHEKVGGERRMRWDFEIRHFGKWEDPRVDWNFLGGRICRSLQLGSWVRILLYMFKGIDFF